MELSFSVVWLALVICLLLRAFRQRNAFERLRQWPMTGGPAAQLDAQDAPAVAVIVPARDEQSNIEACLKSVLAQQFPASRLTVVAVDDYSTDSTAELIERLALADPRLRLLRAPPLAAGWIGKAHACWAGAAALTARIEWLCFLDADMRAEPCLLRSAVHIAAERQLDLLSLAPRHELRSFPERLILPCGLYLLAFCQDLVRIQAPDSGDAVATGQFLLVRRSAYAAVGGHASVRRAICEDVELARLLKRSGYRVLMQDGGELLSTRMYTGWRTLWPGLVKNLTEMLGGPKRTLITAAITVTLAWLTVLLPAWDVLGCLQGNSSACIATGPALLGSAAVLALHVAGAAHFHIPLWYGLLFPLGYSAGAVLAVDSVRWRLTGRMRWRGRTYP